MPPTEITLEEARFLAQRAGLTLSDAQLQAILPGVNRSKGQMEDLRALIGKNDEPAGAFNATAGH
jgi:hypothetical protein